jgi:hypothetical protein
MKRPARLGTDRFRAEVEALERTLKPCPFCGSAAFIGIDMEARLFEGRHINLAAWVSCGECEATGPDAAVSADTDPPIEAAELAHKAWNARTPDGVPGMDGGQQG